MAYVPNSNSVVAFQGTVPWSVLGNGQSVSGTVNVGNFPVNQNVSGSVVSFQGTTPWIITGSVQAAITLSANQSVSGTVGASVIGTVPVVQSGTVITSISGTVPVAVQGSVATVIIGGSIAASFTPPANQSVSGTVGASIIGTAPVTQAGTWIASVFGNMSVIGTVPVTQSTTPWVITGSVQATAVANQSVSGTIGASIIGLTPVNVTVVTPGTGALNLGKAEDTQHASGDVGVMALFVRNDAGSVLSGNDGDYVPGTTDASGALRVDINGTVSSANSTTATLTANSVFTGTAEDVLIYNEIRISLIASHASATDGLSIQQSSDGTNWDITDTYTIPATTGKTYAVPRQARYMRIVYTNGGTNQTSFRLQTILNRIATMASSQRATDGYTNETDLEQVQGFNMVYNGATWDRQRGTTAGTFVIGSVQAAVSGSVIAFQGGTQITSISGNVPVVGSVNAIQQGAWTVSVVGNVGQTGTVISSISGGQASVFQGGAWTVSVAGLVNVAGSVAAFQAGTIITSVVGGYAEDSAHADGNQGLFVLGVRNDAVASFVSANTDYSPIGVDSAGRTLSKPFAAEEARVEGYNSVVSTSVTTLVGAAGTGLRNYITDVFIANTGAVATLVTFRSGGGTSILGYTIAPAGGGSNLPGLATPIRTLANETFDFQATTSTSVLFATVKGYKAP